MHKLPAGRYYIGDPCYVFTPDTWDRVLTAVNMFEEDDIQHLDDHELWAQSTAWGDGTYLDQNGAEYAVDSGTIGVIPLALVDNPEGLEHGTVMDFPKGVTVECEDGTFRIGNICIKTNDTDGDDDDDGGYDLDPEDDRFM